MNIDKEKLVSIVILNYITWENTYDCLKALTKISYKNHKIFILDNHSQNSSLEKLQTKLKSEKYTPILNEKDILDYNLHNEDSKIFFVQCNLNYGYSIGNNIGIKFAERFFPTYILILNNDTLPSQIFSNI